MHSFLVGPNFFVVVVGQVVDGSHSVHLCNRCSVS